MKKAFPNLTEGEKLLLSDKFLKKNISTVVNLVCKEKKEQKKLTKQFQIYLRRGKIHMKKMCKELSSIDKMLKKNPDNYELLKRRIDYLLHRFYRPELCKENGEKLLKVCPPDKLDEAYCIYGDLKKCSRSGNKDDEVEGMKYIDMALKLNPNSAYALITKAELYAQTQFLNTDSEYKIFGYLETALSIDSNNIRILLTKAFFLEDFGKINEAREFLENSCKNVSWHFEKYYYNILSRICNSENDSKGAIINALKSVLLQPLALICLNGLGVAYQQWECHEAALELAEIDTSILYDKYGSLDDRSRLFLANCYFRCKKYDDSLKHSLIALENGGKIKNKIYSFGALLIGFSYYEMKDYMNAAKYFYIGVEKDISNDGDAKSWLGHALYGVYSGDTKDEITMEDILKDVDTDEKSIGSVLENSCFCLFQACLYQPLCSDEFRIPLELYFNENRKQGTETENDDILFYRGMFHTFSRVLSEKIEEPFLDISESENTSIYENIIEKYRKLHIYARAFQWVCRILYLDDYCVMNVGKTFEDRDEVISSLISKVEPWEEIKKRRDFICEEEQEQTENLFNLVEIKFSVQATKIHVMKILFVN